MLSSLIKEKTSLTLKTSTTPCFKVVGCTEREITDGNKRSLLKLSITVSVHGRRILMTMMMIIPKYYLPSS